MPTMVIRVDAAEAIRELRKVRREIVKLSIAVKWFGIKRGIRNRVRAIFDRLKVRAD